MANTTWNPSDQTNTTLTSGNLLATANASSGGVRSIDSKTTGKYYWEFTATPQSDTATGYGVGNASAFLATVSNTVVNACLVYNNGLIWLAGSSTGMNIGAISNGTLVGLALDAGGKLLWMRIGAAGNWNGSGTANPATGAGGVNIASIAGSAIFPLFAFAAKTTPSQACTANFGDSAFTGAVPGGFTSGFPTPSLARPMQTGVAINTG